MYRILNQPHSRPLIGHVQRKCSGGTEQRHAAMALEHSQLVETICATDGISVAQAESQVTAFEQQFKDDPL